ncbi:MULTISPECIES: hypothetical protein [unclassified Streptomyces]|uniref:hypothetical protein n=1 Tax=unclassified Streptomyces TaxID=2593676 RepID=UPI002E35F009|nr:MULTISPECIES: hypothetical protein [unclassified Streptomyces]
MMERALWQGVVAGTAGGIVMTLGEKVEQAMTGRPDSHVPARVLKRLTPMAEQPGRQTLRVNVRGPLASGRIDVPRRRERGRVRPGV